MTVKRLGATVLWTEKLEEVRSFYSILGLKLEEENHGEGPRHYATDLSGVHFSIYEAGRGIPAQLDRGQSGFTHLGFAVDDLDACFERLKVLGAQVVWECQSKPWGRAAMFLDPDGRSVEIFEG